MRESCCVRFHCWELASTTDCRFVNTLKTLVGFETVILAIDCPWCSFEPALCAEIPKGRRKAKWPLMKPIENQWLSQWEEQREMLRAVLDSTLGPGEIYDVGLARCLEFHPLRHLSRQSATSARKCGLLILPWLLMIGVINFQEGQQLAKDVVKSNCHPNKSMSRKMSVSKQNWRCEAWLSLSSIVVCFFSLLTYIRECCKTMLPLLPLGLLCT